VRFSLSEPATVALAVHKRGAKRFVRIGALRRSSAAGGNRVPFSGRLRGRALAPGRYRLTLVARDAAGQRSAPVRRRFRIESP
jgi:hypothetical protein